MRYRGITYPFGPIFRWNWMYNLWKKYMCPHGMHLLDECESNEHYLICDACGLIIHIDRFDQDEIIRN
jgi:hypothetical protein